MIIKKFLDSSECLHKKRRERRTASKVHLTGKGTLEYTLICPTTSFAKVSTNSEKAGILTCNRIYRPSRLRSDLLLAKH